jgi:hypothetical protein
MQLSINKTLNFLVFVRSQHRFQSISLFQNFVALFQNKVTEKNRQQNSTLKSQRDNTTKSIPELPYPSDQNEASVVEQRRRCINFFDDHVEVNQNSGRTVDNIERENAILQLLQNVNYLL